MKRAVIRLGRRYAGERPGEIPPGLLRYGHEMKLATWQANVPLLLDHDEAKRIGTVDELVTFDDVDGRWLCARAAIYPDAGRWVRKGSPASFKSALLHESSFVPGYIYGAYVQEVSILQAEKPARTRRPPHTHLRTREAGTPSHRSGAPTASRTSARDLGNRP
jgi:hypothetical protein